MNDTICICGKVFPKSQYFTDELFSMASKCCPKGPNMKYMIECPDCKRTVFLGIVEGGKP